MTGRYLSAGTSEVPLRVWWDFSGGRCRIVRIEFVGKKSRYSPQDAPPEIAGLCQCLSAVLRGEQACFDPTILAWDGIPSFHRQVITALLSIPAGKVTTYGRLAQQLGCSNGARAVGQALARNPFPVLFPCHRVVRSDRSLGGFGGGLRVKRLLLEHEGVVFTRDGRVDSLSMV